MSKSITGKDFRKNIGKHILIPHPHNPFLAPKKLRIEKSDKKRIRLVEVDGRISYEGTFSNDKNKYLLLDE